MATSLNLTGYSSVKQATFVKMTVLEYGTPTVVRTTTNDTEVSIVETDGQSYTYSPMGNLLNISDFTGDLKATQNDITVTFSGLDAAFLNGILANPIKGSVIEIRRGFFDPTTNQLLSISGNPTLEFKGVVVNYNIEEGWTDQATQAVTVTIALSCSSIMSLLSNKISGRRTNQADQTYWYSGDLSMNRVAVIADAVFDFGGNTPAPAVTTPVPKSITIV